MRTKNTVTYFLLMIVSLFVSAYPVQAADECSRAWAIDKAGAKNFKVIGLGLSSQTDGKIASDEAKAAAFKDIALQLQSSVQSRSEVKETQSESGFSGSAVLTSHIEDLVGLKALKSGKNLQENITYCEVYEFNVQSAYEDQISQLAVVQEKIDKIKELASKELWIELIRETPSLKPLVSSLSVAIKRADLFKAFLNAPGPGWGERFEKAVAQFEDLDKKARGNLVFIFPKDQFDEAVEEVRGLLTNSGTRSGLDPSEVGSGVQGIQVAIKSLGKPRKSKTKLGLTISRKVSIVLIDLKTKRKLAANKGLSLVGTSSNDDDEEALTNSENQLVGAIADAIRNIAPGLLRD